MTKEKSKPSFKDQFVLNSVESCLAAIKNGWVAGLISIGLTFVVVVIGMYSNTDNATLNYFADPTIFIDLVLMAIMVFFIRKKSRIAATCMFLYFIISKYIQWSDLGTMQGLPMAVIFMILYFNAMRATFIWHSKFKVPLVVESEI